MRRWLTILLLTLGACHHRADLTPAPAWSTVEIAVTVVNHNWSDARIYLLHDGITERLGVAIAEGSATFSIPGRDFASGAAIRLRASLIGSSARITTEPILVQPDQDVVWTIEGYLPNSSVIVE
jgi:hypothetical protein